MQTLGERYVVLDISVAEGRDRSDAEAANTSYAVKDRSLRRTYTSDEGGGHDVWDEDGDGEESDDEVRDRATTRPLILVVLRGSTHVSSAVSRPDIAAASRPCAFPSCSPPPTSFSFVAKEQHVRSCTLSVLRK